ncbi:hypothetical protein D3C75_1009200 [compost metagenome]
MFNDEMRKHDIVAGIALFGQKGCRGGTAHNGLHPVDHFTRTEGFDHIIVSPHLEALHPVDLLAFGCKHQNGRRFDTSEPGQHFYAVDSRQHHIQQNQAVIIGRCFAQSDFSVFCLINFVAFFFKIHLQQAANALLVIHHQYSVQMLCHFTTTPSSITVQRYPYI